MECFGDIFMKKRRFWAQLAGVQKLPIERRTTKWLKLEKKIQSELEEVLHQEELLLFQRSREEWIASRNRNVRLRLVHENF